jgi:hypothetical protein
MITPELVVAVVGFAVTFGTMLYKFGRLEGSMLARLTALEHSVDELRSTLHGRRGVV